MALISDSHVPKYVQIADIFRQRIARGVWAHGLRLPVHEATPQPFERPEAVAAQPRGAQPALQGENGDAEHERRERAEPSEITESVAEEDESEAN